MTVASQTSGRRSTTLQSPRFISGEREDSSTEARKQRTLSQRHGTAGEPPEFIGGCDSTHNLRRYFVTCGFLLSAYNDLGFASRDYRHPIVLSDFENKSAHSAKSMSHHNRTTSHNHRQTDVSTTNHNAAPIECPACDCPEISTENDLWRCTLCNASDILGGGRA
jgi:hypothetical protein